MDASGTYELPQSGLRLRDLMLVRFLRAPDKTESVIADYPLADLSDVRLRVARGGGDRWAIWFCVFFVAVAGVGIWSWALPSGNALPWLVCGSAAFLSVLSLRGAMRFRTAWLVLLGSRHGPVEIELSESVDVARAFFGEIREQADVAKLRVSFRELP